MSRRGSSAIRLHPFPLCSEGRDVSCASLLRCGIPSINVPLNLLATADIRLPTEAAYFGGCNLLEWAQSSR